MKLAPLMSVILLVSGCSSVPSVCDTGQKLDRVEMNWCNKARHSMNDCGHAHPAMGACLIQ